MLVCIHRHVRLEQDLFKRYHIDGAIPLGHFELYGLFMQTPSITKYVFQIRSRNGAIVDNLQIYGRDENDAIRKLQQMYPHCEILDSRIATPGRIANSSYEDVLDLIAKHPLSEDIFTK